MARQEPAVTIGLLAGTVVIAMDLPMVTLSTSSVTSEPCSDATTPPTPRRCGSAPCPWAAARRGLPVDDPVAMGATTVIAAGAGVVPDLDHPDAYPSRQFGMLTKIVSWATRSATGGRSAQR